MKVVSHQRFTALATILAVCFLSFSCSMGTTDPVSPTSGDESARAVADPTAAAAALNVTTIASWETLTSIQNDVTLPSSVTVDGNTWTVSWASTNAAIIATTGKVTRPANSTRKNSVTLTATGTRGTLSFAKTFNCAVIGKNYRLSYYPSIILSLTDSTGKLVSLDYSKCYETLILPKGQYYVRIAYDDSSYAVKTYNWYVNDQKKTDGPYVNANLYLFNPAYAGNYSICAGLVHYSKNESEITSFPLNIVLK